MRILGVDPGIVIMGYGVIESKEGEIALVDCGALKTSARSPIGERLSYLYKELSSIMSSCQPDAVAVEQPFMSTNVSSFL